MQKHKLYYFEYQSFVKSEKGKQLFYQHCKKECNLEAFEFCCAVEAFQQMPSTEAAKKIIDEFVKPGSKSEINVSNKIRESILSVNLGTATDMKDLFQKAHFANSLLISQDVFSRFIHTPEFLQMVEVTQEKHLIATFGAQLMANLPEYLLHVENLERSSINVNDLCIAAHILKDYYCWIPVLSDPKGIMTGHYAKTGVIGDDVKKAHGEFIISKLAFNVTGVSALELFHVTVCSNYAGDAIKNMPNHALLEWHNEPNEYTYANVTADMIFPMSQARDTVTANICIYNPSSKTYFSVYKSCNHDKFPVNKKKIRAKYVTVVSIQEVDDNVCRLVLCSCITVKSTLQSIASLLGTGYVTTFMTKYYEGIEVAKKDYLKEKESKHKYEHKGPFDTIPGFDDFINGVKNMQENGKKNMLFPTI